MGEIDFSNSSHQGDETIPPDMLNKSSNKFSDPSVQKNISTLMDMIHTLQGQVNKLTEKVNKLVIQASTPSIRSDSVINISQPDRNSNIVNAGNVTPDPLCEINHNDSVTSAENLQGTYIVSDNTRLTSTLMPRSQSHPSES